MIDKLKRKIILLATFSVFLLMAVLLTIMNAVNYTTVVKGADGILDIITQPDTPFFDGKTPPEKPNNTGLDFIPKGMSPEVPYESRFFTVTVSNTGEILESDFSKIVSVTNVSMKSYMKKAIKQHSNRGFVKSFRFAKVDSGGNTKIFFLDCGRKLNSFYNFLWTSIGVGLFGCITVCIMFLFVSDRIIKPIAESYNKQRRFISDASHEIKTPLTIINANLDLIDDDSQEEIAEIRQQTNRLASLTNDLILLSKMDEKGNSVQRISLPLSDLVSETAASFHAPAVTKSIRFSINVIPDISINGSPNAIRQLVSILCDNAVKYAPSGTDASVSLSEQKKTVTLSVSNTTESDYSKEELSRLFDRFYRTDKSRNSKTGGYGIGLSVAHAITFSHNGKIFATAKDGIFTVTVVLPK